MNARWTAALLIAAAVAGYVLFPFAFTVVPIDQGGVDPEAFDAVAFVDASWEEIEATVRNDAVDLSEVLGAIAADAEGRVAKDDLTAVTEQYGRITAGEAHVYLVRATGTVSAVDTSSSVGTLQVDLDGYEGPTAVQVYIGPRIPSDESSIRDGVGFISFGDFRDQTEYGRVASELNGRVVDMLATVDPEALEGTTITVLGAMTIRTFNLVSIDVESVHVVPVAIEQS
jgi:predicted lipoprotein